jgi:hypothetical protein
MHERRTHLANVLLALQLLQRMVPPYSPQALAVRAGLVSARALIELVLNRGNGKSERPNGPTEPEKNG